MTTNKSWGKWGRLFVLPHLFIFTLFDKSQINKNSIGLYLLLLLLVTGCSTTPKPKEQINVWWAKGYYQQEDYALFEAISKFESKNPEYKINLSLLSNQEVVPKTLEAIATNIVPDVAYSDSFDFSATSKWAYDGILEDIGSILIPKTNQYDTVALSTTYLFDNIENRRAYYAFPLRQQILHVSYWKDMLSTAGFKESDIPKDWNGYWSFWCDKVQTSYRAKTNTRSFGAGFPMGVNSSDSFYSFLSFMDAHNVKLVNDLGGLQVSDPFVRAAIINAMNDYIAAYRKGCTPPTSTTWTDPDNNVAFHNKTIVMTHNAATSIATKWLDDADNQRLTQAHREAAKKNYVELIATTGFPNKPDGNKMMYRTSVKTGVIFKAANNKVGAKKFISFLLEDENLTPYVEGSSGRWFPITKTGQKREFWQRDAHRQAVYNQYQNGTLAFEFTKNHKFITLNSQNVWAKAMNRILSERWSTEQAVDELIAQIIRVVESR